MKVNKRPTASNTTPKTAPNNFAVRITLLLLVIITYSSSIGFDYTLDDESFVRQNTLVQQGVSAIAKIFTSSSIPGSSEMTTNHPYRPVATFSFAMDKSLYGNSAAASHLVNLILYAILLQVLLTLLIKLAPDNSAWVAHAIVLLYAVHPIHTEVICNIKSRDELLAALFGFLSWSYYLNVFSSTEKKNTNLTAAAIFLLLALFSKESAITFTALLPLSILLFKRSTFKDTALRSWPLLIAAILFLAARQSAVGHESPGKNLPVLDNILNAAPGFATQTATRCMILFQYLKLLVFPWPMNWDYSYQHLVACQWNITAAWAGLLCYSILIVLSIFFLRRNPWISFSILFYLITISPVSNLLFVSSTNIGERFLFVPSLSLCILIVHLAARLSKSNLFEGFNKNRRLVFGSYVVLITICVFTSRTQAAYWKDNFSLFEHGVVIAPNSVRTNYNLANEYWKKSIKEQDPSKASAYSASAIHHFKRCLELLPDNFMAMTNLGCVYDLRGNFDSSNYYFLNSLRLEPNQIVVRKNLANIYLKRGNQLEKTGDGSLAPNWYIKSFNYDSSSTSALNALVTFYGNKTRFDSAVNYLNKALMIDPNDRSTLENAAVMAFFSKKYEDAISYSNRAINLYGRNRRMLGVLADSYHAIGNDSAVARYVQEINSLPGL